jgi:hypothetical protein
MRHNDRTTFDATIPIGFGKKGDIAEIDTRITITGLGYPVAIEVRVLGSEEYVDVSSPVAFAGGVAGLVWGSEASKVMAEAVYRAIILWLGSRPGAKRVREAIDEAETGPSPAEAKQIAAFEMQRGG